MSKETASSEARWDADRIRRVRRRLVGATILLLLVLLVIPLLDNEQVMDEHDIAMTIPHAPSDGGVADQIDLSLPEAPPGVSSSTVIVDPAITGQASSPSLAPPPASLPPLRTDPSTSTPSIPILPERAVPPTGNAGETARTEQLRQEAVKAEQKRQEALKAAEAKKAEEARKAEAAKKAEEAKKLAEAKKAEDAKKAAAARNAEPPSALATETWIKPNGAPSSSDETARAVAILEGGASASSGSTATAQSRQYVIQVGAYRQKTMLEDYQTKIRALGLTPFVQTAVIDGVETNRLRVGPFANREAAEAGLKKLNTIGLNGQISAHRP